MSSAHELLIAYGIADVMHLISFHGERHKCMWYSDGMIKNVEHILPNGTIVALSPEPRLSFIQMQMGNAQISASTLIAVDSTRNRTEPTY
jgi:hypothetical protein